MPTPTATARSWITVKSISRRSGSSSLLSATPRMRRSGAMMTAAATTGPARGPRPASSTPAIRVTPVFQAFASYRYGAVGGGTPGGASLLLVGGGGGRHDAGALFLDARRLARERAQVVELAATDLPAAHHVHLLDARRVDG